MVRGELWVYNLFKQKMFVSKKVEVHHGLSINVADVIIDFSMDIEKAADLLDNISSDNMRLTDGTYSCKTDLAEFFIKFDTSFNFIILLLYNQKTTLE